jgi:hypothetical protein
MLPLRNNILLVYAVHYPNRVNYYALMAICDVARKKYGTPVWLAQNEKC